MGPGRTVSKRRRPFVAVETDVVKDESFAVLGDVCGYNRDEALGRVFRMWAWCADRKLRDAPEGCPGYAVPEGVVVRFLGPDGVRGILGDGVAEFALGERWGDLIYLRGTDATVTSRRSKINGAIAGGEARAREVLATGARDSGGLFVSDDTTSPADSPPGSSVDPRSQIPDPSEDLPPARDPAVRDTAPEHTLRASPPPPPAIPPSLDGLWTELENERREVADFHGIEYRPLVAHDRGRHELADALVQASRSGKREQLVGDARHAIAVAGAEARADRDRVKWLTGAIFSPDNFRRLAAEDLEQASRPRAGPRGSAGRAPEPIRKIKTL